LSEAAAVELVRRNPTSRGGWVVGRGWNQNAWPGTAFPTRASLDAAFPTTPVALTRVDGHAVWVNSEALRRVGISAATRDPEGGRVLRDASGAPTGVLVDNAATLVETKRPPPTADERAAELKLALETCARVGLTSVHDAGMDLETFRVLQQWDMVGALPVRVYVMVAGQGAQADEFLGLGRFKGRRLEARAVKLVLDGALGSRGAALLAPYTDEPTQSGLLLLSDDELEGRARRFAEAGFQVAIHAIGDRANAKALDLLSGLERARPGSRHRIEHAQVLRAEDVKRFASEHLIASFQPTHATSDMPWAEARLGPERVRLAYAWRSVLATGASLAFGSDFPVESPNPMLGLAAARSRTDADGHPEGGWHPEQRLTGLEALAGFTTGTAFASFSEGERGQLAPGFSADFVVLTADPVEDDVARVRQAAVLLTVVDGVDVFRAK
jgi:predicted amidohydrolase YtcJ